MVDGSSQVLQVLWGADVVQLELCASNSNRQRETRTCAKHTDTRPVAHLWFSSAVRCDQGRPSVINGSAQVLQVL